MWASKEQSVSRHIKLRSMLRIWKYTKSSLQLGLSTNPVVTNSVYVGAVEEIMCIVSVSTTI